jgi:ligand-binding SRPBCC domain-containing protein/uncharacterized protein YbgA (DUF1722 family)
VTTPLTNDDAAALRRSIDLRFHALEHRVSALQSFHRDAKFLVHAHGVDALRELGRIAAGARAAALDDAFSAYGATLSRALARTPERGRVADALQHMYGFLKKHLPEADRHALLARIDAFRRSELPLAAVLADLQRANAAVGHPYLATQELLSAMPPSQTETAIPPGAARLFQEQWLPAPPEEVWAFFSDERNLEAITPPWIGFHIVGKSTPAIVAGTRIRYRLRIHGLPLGWETLISVWEPHSRFVDVQTRGPYAFWHHTHSFAPERGGTRLTDEVRWVVPFGALGRLIAGRLVARDVQRIFAYRREAVARRFSPKGSAPGPATSNP